MEAEERAEHQEYNAFNRGTFCVCWEQEAKETVDHRAYNITRPDSSNVTEETKNGGKAHGKGVTPKPSMVID